MSKFILSRQSQAAKAKDFPLSCRRKASKAKDFPHLWDIYLLLWNAGHHDKARKLLTKNLVRLGYAAPKQPGKVGRKGGLPQPLDFEILRLRQQGITQRVAGESVGLTSDYRVIETRVRAAEKRLSAALADPKLLKEYQTAVRMRHGTDFYVTSWGILTGAELSAKLKALNQQRQEITPSL